jgi:hypothetical protein
MSISYDVHGVPTFNNPTVLFALNPNNPAMLGALTPTAYATVMGTRVYGPNAGLKNNWQAGVKCTQVTYQVVWPATCKLAANQPPAGTGVVYQPVTYDPNSTANTANNPNPVTSYTCGPQN